MKVKNLAILSILTLTLLTGCSDKEKIDQNVVANNNQKQEKEVVQKPAKKHEAPKFDLKTVDGKTISIIANNNGWQFQGLENKVVLLDFFATWCPPCRAEIPHLVNLKNEFKGKFEVIGLNIGERDGSITPNSVLQDFKKQFNINYPIAAGQSVGALYHALGNLNESNSIPFMLIFNTKGEFLQSYIGLVDEAMLNTIITNALKSK